MVDDLEGSLMADGHGQGRCHKGKDDGKDERLRQPTLHQTYTKFNHNPSILIRECVNM